MLKSLYKKLHSLWESPEQPAKMPFATTQTLPMRYIDIDVLQDQLNQILGEDGWDSQESLGSQYVIGVKRELTLDEIEKIKDASRSHYKQFSTEGHSCT